MKKYIFILIALVILAALVVFGLYLWKNGSLSIPGGTTGSIGTTGTLPSAGTQGTSSGTTTGTASNGGTTTGSNGTGAQTSGTSGAIIVAGSFGPLSNDPVLNYFVQPNNTVLALEPNGVVAKIVNGQTSYLSSSTATNVISGAFSFDGKKALLSFGDPSNPQTSVFDVSSTKWTALPQGMQSPQWSPAAADYRIAYLVAGTGGTETLATINAAAPKSAAAALLTLHINDQSLQWTTKTTFIIADKPSYQAPGSALLYNSAQGIITPIALNVAGFESAWSGALPASVPAEGMFSYNSGQGTDILQLVNGAGGVLQNLSLQTLPTKCGFGVATTTVVATTSATSASATSATTTATSTRTTGAPKAAAPTSTAYLALYCGIPRDATGFAAAHLPDDYNQMALFTSDDIYRVNTQTGEAEALWNASSQNVDVSDLKTFSNEIFFVDRYTNKLFALTLQGN